MTEQRNGVVAERLQHEDVARLIGLLLQDRMQLTDAEVAELLAHTEELGQRIYWLHRSYPYCIQDVQQYRVRKKDLSELPTKELQRRMKALNDRRAAIPREDVDDEIDDSFFEPDSINSDAHILHELLEERRKE
ncbi:MAG: hypothetical protein A3B37_02885 [Candidatus Sungbacteria bacterium RIFCSPLOWO2_01_FULL_59_16]|uniref:Uncharacterized protein n=1 Tax=Candidatus Sungbacteria bacterium RIFCSPLOWO2_01_FULL_59_16 TaxID=1802280 RepID=A0A1G2LBV4_9BACT|nr:MAG: hypothetical protein A3B37_02885 [Candidatus Sungbacteria bacterium RIFCSPLOWO2_01_FULL_59_16]